MGTVMPSSSMRHRLTSRGTTGSKAPCCATCVARCHRLGLDCWGGAHAAAAHCPLFMVENRCPEVVLCIMSDGNSLCDGRAGGGPIPVATPPRAVSCITSSLHYSRGPLPFLALVVVATFDVVELVSGGLWPYGVGQQVKGWMYAMLCCSTVVVQCCR